MLALPVRAFRQRWLVVTLALVLLFVLVSGIPSASVQAVSSNVVISQVYGGGGNSGATYKYDFVELYNLGAAPVDLSTWSVQYASATGSTWQVTPLTGSIAPGKYYLVQEAKGSGGTLDLPTPNATGTILMAAGAGKVALVSNSTALSGTCPTGGAIVDFVGFGGANCSETTPTAVLSNTTGALRTPSSQDTDNNASDFYVGYVDPRNSTKDGPPFVSSTAPANSTGVAVNSNIIVYFNEPVNAAAGWYNIACTISGTHAATVTGGPGTFTLDPTTDFVQSEQCTVTVTAAKITDQDAFDPDDGMPADYVRTLSTVAPANFAYIHDIQGAGHISPKNGTTVATSGIVTAKKADGFFMQDPAPDTNPATSEGIYVYTKSKPTVNPGDNVMVTGQVSEYRSSSAPGNLTLTEITGPTVDVRSTGNTLPAATLVGTGGRVPPTTVFEDDAVAGDVEVGNTFDQNSDGLDFYESLEGMLVQINNPVVVGPSNSYWEVPVLPDGGANASVRTPRGGIVARSGDFNPERMVIDDEVLKANGIATVNLNVKDSLNGPVVGPLYYDFGLFMVELTGLPSVTSGGLTKESAPAAPAYQLSIGTFNVENLAPGDSQTKYNTLAGMIVNNLKSPDILAVEEIQDNNGTADDGTVDASMTYAKLIAAIKTAGGPTYQYRQINPVDGEDGGAPGGNIRQGFLFNPARGVGFTDKPGGTSTAAVTVQPGPTLSFNPGRIDPTNGAFTDSRKPLAGEFTFKGDKVFVIANHFNSKGGDSPLFGHFQPPQLLSQAQRIQQAQVVHNFVDSILTQDSKANIVVLGDLNDFQFAPPLLTLKGSPAVLNDLIETLPENQRYSYVYEGNSETLDHILIGNSTLARPYQYQVVHVNSEFWDQASDHEPQVARLCVDATLPKAVATPNVLWPANHNLVNIKVTVGDNADPNPSVQFLSVTSNEPDNGLGDGDTPNDIVRVDDFNFQLRAERSGTGPGRVYTIKYQVSDACGNSGTVSASVTVPHDLAK